MLGALRLLCETLVKSSLSNRLLVEDGQRSSPVEAALPLPVLPIGLSSLC